MKTTKLLISVLAIIVMTLLITNCGTKSSPREYMEESLQDSSMVWFDTIVAPTIQDRHDADSVLDVQKDSIAKNDTLNTNDLSTKDSKTRELAEFQRKQIIHERNLKKLEYQNKIMDSLIMKK